MKQQQDEKEMMKNVTIVSLPPSCKMWSAKTCIFTLLSRTQMSKVGKFLWKFLTHTWAIEMLSKHNTRYKPGKRMKKFTREEENKNKYIFKCMYIDVCVCVCHSSWQETPVETNVFDFVTAKLCPACIFVNKVEINELFASQGPAHSSRMVLTHVSV